MMIIVIIIIIITNDNQRLQSAGDNDHRTKCFCLYRSALGKFRVTDSQNTHDQTTSDGRSKHA